MPKQYHDPDWLHHHYWEQGKTQKQIAIEAGVSPTTIGKMMKKHGIKTRKPTGKYHGHYGTQRSEQTKQKISQTLQGRELTHEWRDKISESLTGNSIPQETRDKISRSLTGIKRSKATRRKMSNSTKGENNPKWNGGYHESWYQGVEWKIAKEEIKNTQLTCQACMHDGSSDALDIHHIVPIRFFDADTTLTVTDAHVLGNLIRLCRPCHTKAEFGDIVIKPNFESIPKKTREDIFRLWKLSLDS